MLMSKDSIDVEDQTIVPSLSFLFSSSIFWKGNSSNAITRSSPRCITWSFAHLIKRSRWAHDENNKWFHVHKMSQEFNNTHCIGHKKVIDAVCRTERLKDKYEIATHYKSMAAIWRRPIKYKTCTYITEEEKKMSNDNLNW